ncbi:predicted protein [Botrytis cinerea T4]|uniref:Uncharacterized protein n=1 Tax=Botryotinia fuckeliana (strain T4) TaxID=999810 RepID=G2YIJ9_BOTF4|nr:predicted protein [Botrytis cinerea T4]
MTASLEDSKWKIIREDRNHGFSGSKQLYGSVLDTRSQDSFISDEPSSLASKKL